MQNLNWILIEEIFNRHNNKQILNVIFKLFIKYV